jgi:sulfur relay (sulfurtransferase) DsrF/TusC family protein
MLIEKMYPSRTSGYGNKAVAEALEAIAGFYVFCHADEGGIFFRSFTPFRMTKNKK